MRYESIVPRLEIEQKLERIHTTADGKRTKLCDMEESHLLNLIKWVESKSLGDGAPVTDWFDDGNGNFGDVVTGRMDALQSLRHYGYQDLVDVYNYRFGGEGKVVFK